MGQNSLIEHRANYFFLKLEEDYISIFPEEDKHSHCKAAILSILEHWMNAKRTDTSREDDLYIYLSYPQFAKHMFKLYGRSTIIKCLEELEQEGLILKRPYTDQFNQETFEYRLNIKVVQARLSALPDIPIKGSSKMNGGSSKINDPSLKTDEGSSKNTLGGRLNLNEGSFKSKRNLDTTIDTNLDTPQINKEEGAVSDETRTATADEDNIIDWKKATDGRLPAIPKGATNEPSSDPSTSLPGIPGDRHDLHAGPGEVGGTGRDAEPRSALHGEQATTERHSVADRPVESLPPDGAARNRDGAHDEPRASCMALTPQQIQKQLDKRIEEIFALYEQKIRRKPTRSKANLDGALKLAQDDVSDEDIGTTIAAILADSFHAKNLNLTYVHGKIDAFAKKPTPIRSNGPIRTPVEAKDTTPALPVLPPDRRVAGGRR